MFDNPYAQNWEPGGAKPIRGRPSAALVVLVLATALAIAGFAWPRPNVSIVGSPSALRQIEVFTLPAGLGHAAGEAFYLRNAGYRLRHRARLLGTAYGPQGWSVHWHGEGAVDIILPRGCRFAASPATAGLAVSFRAAR